SHTHTLADWKQRQKWVKKTLMDIVGSFPEKTPLDARIMNTVREEGYTIENIIYESQPGFYVTSSLFIPNGLKEKAPAIIYCSGHVVGAYRNPIYQHGILNLVKKGFIVFAFDPVGEGERIQYYDPETGKSTVGGMTQEHSYAGAQAFITGSSQARYEIWDGIRAVDYLLTRKEVDPSRIGITGGSGGGTQSAYIAALDDRIYAAAPERYITNFTRLIQAVGPQDAEQNLYHEIARGIDHPDLLEVRAPKPTLMITTTRDFFPIQGAIETAKEVSRIFKAYDKSADFYRVEDDTTHAFTKKNREAMYSFFQKYLNNPGDSEDMDAAPLPGADLQVAPTGQISTSFKGAETVFSLNLKDAEKCENRLQSLRKNYPEYLSNILRGAKSLSGYKNPAQIYNPVFTGRYDEDNYVIEKYFVKGEGNYVIPYLLMIPDKSNGKAVICLNPASKSEELDNNDAAWFVKRGFTVLAPDLLGVGELGNNNSYKSNSFIDSKYYSIWYLSILTDKSIVGIRAEDIVRLADLLKGGRQIKEVYGLARGTMCAPMLYAAAFDEAIKRICLIEPLSSYRSIVMNRFYNPHFIYSTVAGALKAYDLPDLEASLAPRKLMMMNILDGGGKQINNENDHDILVVKKAYLERKADSRLHVITCEKGNMQNLFSDWIK
ncbi:MAG: alpha/beta hydrolase, partial [Chitinophagaceae bacterium]